MFKYETGGFHSCPAKSFALMSDVWVWVARMQLAGRLSSVTFCDENGNIVPYDHPGVVVPGIVEEIVRAGSEPRRWTIQL